MTTSSTVHRCCAYFTNFAVGPFHMHTHTAHKLQWTQHYDTVKQKNRIKLLQLSVWLYSACRNRTWRGREAKRFVSDWSMYRETCQRGLVSNCSEDRVEHCTYTIFDCGS